MQISTEDEPDHRALAEREQARLPKAITEDIDPPDRMAETVDPLCIVLAAIEP